MRYAIHLQPDAVSDLDRLRKFDSTKVLDAIEMYLRSTPTKESGSRIKRLRGRQKADYRLMADDLRVFYNVEGDGVRILRVLSKEETRRFYEPHQGG